MGEKEKQIHNSDAVLGEGSGPEVEEMADSAGKSEDRVFQEIPQFDAHIFEEDPRIAQMNKDFATEQLAELRGEEAPVYGPIGFLWKLKHKYIPDRPKIRLKKKTYILLLIFLGWAGGHRWYQRRFYLAAFMTAFAWTGFPVVLCVTDLMEVIPVKADEDGYIMF